VSGSVLAGLALSAAGALLVLATRQGTVRGAAAGFVVSAVIVTGLGVGAFAPLAVFVLGSGALTRLGADAKRARGLEEANRGRRGAAHVGAKLALPALCGALGLARAGAPDALALVFTAAVAGAFADTAGTEVGPLAGGRVLVLDRGRPTAAPHGAPGGVSLAGFLASVLAAVAVAGTALGAGALAGARAALVAAAAGVAGSLLESVLARTSPGARIGHHGRNGAVSVFSAAGALLARAAGWVKA
jgi:uncharacterized protein (TIGR00297 family)